MRLVLPYAPPATSSETDAREIARIQVLLPIDTRNWKFETVDEHVEQVQGIVRRALRPAQRPLEPTQS